MLNRSGDSGHCCWSWFQNKSFWHKLLAFVDALVGRIMPSSTRCPCPNPWNPGCGRLYAKGNSSCQSDDLEVGRFRGIICRGFTQFQASLYVEEAGGTENPRVRAAWEILLALKMEEEMGHEQGMWVALRSWKRQGNRFSSSASRKNPVLLTSWF